VSAPSTAAASQWEWEGVPRVVVLGDVHGSFDKMVTLLRGTEMVDERLTWKGDNQHLVFCGDLTDRGSNDKAVMDVVRRLQGEAEAAGGKVHLVLGNHEVMNLTRDRRYWNVDLLAAFAKDETQAERSKALGQYKASIVSQTTHDMRAFEEKFPPGYFARARAFEPDGKYGSWLLEQPTVIKVNGVVFVHGGLTPQVAKLGLDAINQQVPANIRKFLDSADSLGDAVPWPRDFGLIMAVAHQAVVGGGGRVDVGAAKVVLEAHEGLAFAAAGPVWYRGTSTDDERLERLRVDEVLKLMDARAEMVGHTVTRTGRINSRFGGKVYRADVGMSYGRPPMAVVLEGGNVLAFDPEASVLTAAIPEPPEGEGWPAGEEDLSDHRLERFLETAEIKSESTLDTSLVEGLAVLVLDLEQKDMKLRALWGDAQETAKQAAAKGRQARRRYQNQVAAYRLDRMLGLHMVPVTVLRKVDGRRGAAQVWVRGGRDRTQISDTEIAGVDEALKPLLARARVFNALIGLEERLDFGKVVLPTVPPRVVVVDNGVSFRVDSEIETLRKEGCGPVGAAFLQALGTLEAKAMKKELGDLLSKAQLSAILQRRDEILRLCEKPDADWWAKVQRNLKRNGGPAPQGL
jgi:hypothetical protein